MSESEGVRPAGLGKNGAFDMETTGTGSFCVSVWLWPFLWEHD